MKTLHTVPSDQYEYNFWEGDEVVRCFKTMDTQYSTRVPGKNLRDVLAIPFFLGNAHDEQIEWQTDAFVSEPVCLDSLSGEEYLRYKGILDKTLGEVKRSVADFPSGAADLFRQAVCCFSENCVWCADDKVVLSNWGMKPKDRLDVSVISMDGIQTAPPVHYAPEIMPETEAILDESKSKPQAGVPKVVEQKADAPRADEPKEAAAVPVAWTSNWMKWLLWIIPLLFLLILAGILLKKGPGNYGMGKLPTEFGPGNVRESDDGLRNEVDNRILLMLEDDSAVDRFVKRFREQYPDKTKYNLVYPDKSLPRLVLEVPAEERDRLMELLPVQFSDYGLSAFPDVIYESESVPTDPGFSGSWERWYFDMINVFDAWNETYGDRKVVVAIIDNGFDLSHPELEGKVIKTYNAVTHSSAITVDEDVHGTHVAATAVGNANNGVGVSGIAPGCSLITVQVGNSAGLISTSAIVDGLLYAINSGVDVVNMSLGGRYNKELAYLPVFKQEDIIRNSGLDEERMWNRLFDMAARKNVTVVLSGGNANVLVGIDPMKRSPKTIRVSAVQPDMYKADFSNYGALSTLSAPGVAIYNAFPGGNYDFMDGTSMAAPVVTGAVALLKSKHHGLQTEQAVRMLQETGIPSPSDVAVIINLGKAMMAEVPNLTARDTTPTPIPIRGTYPPPPNNRVRTTTPGSSQDFPGGVPSYPVTPYSGNPGLGSPYVSFPGGDPGNGSPGNYPSIGTGVPVYGGSPGNPSVGNPGSGNPGAGNNPSAGGPGSGNDPRNNPFLTTPGSGNPMISPGSGTPGAGNNPYPVTPGSGTPGAGNNPYLVAPGSGTPGAGNNPYPVAPGSGTPGAGNNPYPVAPGSGTPGAGNNPYPVAPGSGTPGAGNNPYLVAPGSGTPGAGNNPYPVTPGSGTPGAGNNPYPVTPGSGTPGAGNNPYPVTPGSGTPGAGNNPYPVTPGSGTPGAGNNPYPVTPGSGTPGAGNNPYPVAPGSGTPGAGNNPYLNPGGYSNNPSYGADPSDPCSSVRARYQQLMDELNRLLRDCPDCFTSKPDTMLIPKGVTAADLNGVWKSTTYLHNDSGEPLVLFFVFNGSSIAELIVVEPSGEEYHAPLDVSVDSDIVRLYQTAAASNGKKGYSPYSFTLRPDKDRKSVGSGVNQMDAVNKIAFSLVRAS